MQILVIIFAVSSIVSLALLLLRLDSFALRVLNGVCSHGIEFIIMVNRNTL